MFEITVKKTALQTISISPSLKKRIEQYVNINQQKRPEDQRYKSISAFYNSVLKRSLDIFEKGKTLADLEKFADSEIIQFYELFENLHWIDIENDKECSFKAHISKETHKEEIDFLFNLLSKYSKIDEIDDIFYLK